MREKIDITLKSKKGNGFPLLAVVHLLTVLALLLGCIDRKNLERFLQEPGLAIGASVISASLGAFVGLCIGLAAVRRARASLLGIIVGGATGVLAVGLICSAQPLRLLTAAVAMLVVPMLVRARHA